MKFLSRLKFLWDHKKCGVCLSKGKLVKIDEFGSSIFKECPVCKGTGYVKEDVSKHRIESLLLEQFVKGFKAINGEYYHDDSMFKTFKVREKK